MFAKRHYEKIAEAMQEARIGLNDVFAWTQCIGELARVFERDNRAFDRERFIRACQPGANVRARS